jgi:phosphohistidine swiveling domain-containing protein
MHVLPGLGDLGLLGGHPVLECYAVVTAIVPILGTLIVTVVCAALFVVMVAFGLTVTGRFVYSAVLFSVVFAGVAGAVQASAWLRRRRRPPHVVPLASVGAIGWPARDVGHKAANLAGFAAAGARVALGWVVTADAFEAFLRHNALTPGPDEGPAFAARIRQGKVPRRLLRRLQRALLASTEQAFLLRSSFLDEDRGDLAFPGVYDSVPWDAADGRAALAGALKEVWASYWSERAFEYRQTGGEGSQPPLRRLAVLANVRVPHDDLGFGSSADVRTGHSERHLVERSTAGRECTAMHELLPNVVSELASTPGVPGMDQRFVREISTLAGRAELLLGRHVEIEWGTQQGRVFVYQVRPLTRLPRRRTFTNSYVADTPRYPLTPLSWWFVFGDATPAALVSTGLRRLGLGTLTDDDILVHRGVIYLRWERFKPLFVGQASAEVSFATVRGVSVALGRAALRGRRAIHTPPVPEAPPAGLEAGALLERLVRLRTERLVPLTERQGLEVQAAAVVDGLLRQIARRENVPAPHVETPLAMLRHHDDALRGSERSALERVRSVWFIADREAEISAMRAIDFPEAFLLRIGLGGGGSPPATPAAAPPASARPPQTSAAVRWLVALRDRLLVEREQINANINAVDYEARLVAEALSVAIGARVPLWEPNDVYFLTPGELRDVVEERIDSSTLGHTLRQRRAVHSRNSTFDHPAVVHLDERGEVVSEAPPDFGPDVLTIGIPLGGGVVHGRARVVRTGALVSPESVAGRIVVLPDPAAIWTGVAASAAGVLFARGGPLSHLAIWCRERGIPTIVAARRVYELVHDGDPLELDADRGEVRRG